MIKNTRHFLRLAAVALLLPGLFSCSQGKPETLDLHSEADLTGLTISCTAGSYYERKWSSRDDVKVYACKSEADGLQAVRQGISDVFLTDEVLVYKEARKRLGVKVAFLGEEKFDVAFAIRKGDTALQESFNAFLAQAPLDDIIAYWLEGGPAVPEPVEKAPEEGTAPIRYVLGMNMEPVSYLGEGGKWMGIEPDLLRRYAISVGRPYTFDFQDLGTGVIALQTGQADLLATSLFVTEERKTFVDFTNPYYACRPAYFVKDNGSGGGIGMVDRLKMSLVKEQRWKLIAGGLLETVKITLLSILLGTVLGIGVCAAKRSRRKWVRTAADLYSGFIQGTPQLVLLLIMFYVIFANSGISASLVAIFTFALCFASSSGGIFNTAISSVPRGQTEAGLSLGFTPLKTFTGIVFPQALKKGLPLYTGECVSLLKGTSIVGFIAIQDLTRASDLIRSRTFDALVPLLIVTVIYFLLAWIIRRLLNLFLVKK